MQSRTALSLQRLAIVLGLALAVFAVTVQFVPNAEAGGPPYSGPITQATGPAYFGPAPNPIPYCENPTYFDPFPENVNPIGSIDPIGAPNASVTTDGITMNFELIAEGSPGTQYPGFFPGPGPAGAVIGSPGDQPKGVEMASDDDAIVTLSEPLFYSQWVFTDVDQANEGFDVTPAWTDGMGAVAVFGGDANFDFTGTTPSLAQFNDTNQVGSPSQSINGRVQVDFIGAVTGITMERDTGSGQSGFAVGGGCIPIGVAKEVTAGPTWNGETFDVTYTIRIRNNLPSTATLLADVNAAVAAAASSSGVVGAVEGIPLTQLQLTDLLADPAFSDIEIVSIVNTSGNYLVNFPGYDGINDIDLLQPGQGIEAETEEEFVLTVKYTPDEFGPLGPDCSTTLALTNVAVVSGFASGVDVIDQSDDGADPDPGADNGAGGNDDPSPVNFPCPPAGLQIVKTVVPGPAGVCPSFDDGIVGDGDPLSVTSGDTVTYCISVYNPGVSTASQVNITDPMAPAGWSGFVGDLPGMNEATVSFDLVVDENTPTLNTATATGNGPNGVLPPVDDTAVIAVSPPAVAGIAITKTVIPAGESCDAAVEGIDEFLVGEPGDAVTWCITVINTGETALTNIIVNDDVLGIMNVDVLAEHGGGAAALLVGQSISFSFDGAVPDGGQVNTVSVTATPSDPDGNPLPDYDPVGDSNDAEVGSTSILLEKAVAAGAGADCDTATDSITVEAGTIVTYCFTVSNTGSVSLEVIDIVDSTLGVRVPIPAANQILAPNESVTVAIELEAQDIVNVADVTGTPVDDNGDPIPDAPEPTDDDDAEVDIPANPGISLSKTVVTAGTSCDDAVEGDDEFLVGLPGDAIVWCFTVTNTGDVHLTDVLLDDDLLGLTNYDVLAEHGDSNVLAPGESITFGINDTVPEEGALNVATVTGTPSDPDGDPLPDVDPVDDDNTAEVGSTDVELVKTVVAGAGGDCSTGVDEVTVPEGTTVTYCFTVTNTGSVDLLVTEVNDAVLGVTVPIPSGSQILVSGASVTVSIEVAAVAVVNTAEVTGTPVVGGDPIPDAPEPTDDDDAVVETQTPMLDIVKTVVMGPNGTCPASLADGIAGPGAALDVEISQTVTYCMNVANTGEVDIDNIVVSDPMAPAGFDGAIGTLTAGSEAVVAFDLVVTSDTAPVNTATVTGDGPAGPLPPEDDTAVIDPPVPAPSVAISKTVVPGGESCDDAVEGVDEMYEGQPGEAVTWCISVTNDGNVPLTNVIVNDELIGITNVDVLADYGNGAVVMFVGDTITFGFDGVVPEEDTTNTVSVSADPSDPDGTPIDDAPEVIDSDDADVMPKRADLSLVKSVSDPGPVLPFTLLTYTIVVSNAGPDEAMDVSVTDVMPTGVRLESLPDVDGWDCAENSNGWTCDLDGELAAGDSQTLTYTATPTTAAPLATALVNTATVSSSTPDPNPDNNRDTATTSTALVPAPPQPVLPQPDEVLSTPTVTPPLALTGSSSLVLAALGSLMVLSGGVFNILGARRRRDEESDD